MTIDVTAVNDVATGMPTITGTARVGETLTASTTGIADVDGLPSSGFTWQWIRVATDTSETNIGTDSESYTPVAADEGATIVVEVSFTDQGSTPEGPLRSAATAAVNDMEMGMPVVVRIPLKRVPSDWELKPTAIDAGGQFRLVFATSNYPGTSSSNIAAYDKVVQRPGPQTRPHGDPRLRRQLQGSRLHVNRQCPDAHGDPGGGYGSPDLLGWLFQGRRRLHGSVRRLLGFERSHDRSRKPASGYFKFCRQ